MKKLVQFQRFDILAFVHGKEFTVCGIGEWLDFATKAHLGTKLEVVISKDNTVYIQKDGEHITNLFEKLVFKVPKDIKVPMGAIVEPVNAVATIYGEYQNNLSVKADDVKVVQSPTSATAPAKA